MSLTSAQVCVPCKERKRKCDKLLPSCSLCQRVHRSCYYGATAKMTSLLNSSSTTEVNDKPCATDQPPRSKYQKSLENVLPSPSSDHARVTGYRIEHAITGYVTDAVGSLSKVQQVADLYFSSVHLWWPVIGEVEYRDFLPSIFKEPRADMSLLSLSMALIVLSAKDEITQSPLYTLVKISIAMVEAANLQSLATVQARLILTLFEMGHGIDPAAYISIAATARAAVAMGINIRSTSKSEKQNDAELRVWWGVVMVDRSCTLIRGDGPCATLKLKEPYQLPRDQDVDVLANAEPRDVSTPSNIRVGPFARHAQVSHLLGRLIVHLSEPTADESFNEEEAMLLKHTLNAFVKLLPEESPQPWPIYCGVMGTCFSATITLAESRVPVDSKVSIETALEVENSLRSTLEHMSYIARRFNDNVSILSLEALSPFVPYSLYLAITSYRRLCREIHDEHCWQALSILETMLRHFSRRWLSARHYLKKLYLQPET